MLALVASLAFRNGMGPSIAGAIAIYPATDFLTIGKTGSYVAFGDGEYGLSTADVEWFRQLYVPNATDRRDWRCSPAFAPDINGLPPTLIIGAHYDVLRDEAAAFAGRLAGAKAPIAFRIVSGVNHGFMGRRRHPRKWRRRWRSSAHGSPPPVSRADASASLGSRSMTLERTGPSAARSAGFAHRPCRTPAPGAAARRACRRSRPVWSITVRNGRKNGKVLDIVEADQAYVAGNNKPTLAQCLHGADRRHVVDRKDRCRQVAAREDLLRRAIAADPIDGRPKHKILPVRDSRRRRASRYPRSLSRPVDVSSESVTCAISRWPTAIRCSTRRRAPPTLSLTIRSQSASGSDRSIRDKRKAAAQQRQNAGPRSIACGRQQQPLDAVRDEVLDVFPLQSEIALAVAEENAVARLPRRVSAPRTTGAKNGLTTSGTIRPIVCVFCEMRPRAIRFGT